NHVIAQKPCGRDRQRLARPEGEHDAQAEAQRVLHGVVHTRLLVVYSLPSNPSTAMTSVTRHERAYEVMWTIRSIASPIKGRCGSTLTSCTSCSRRRRVPRALSACTLVIPGCPV